MTRGLNYTLIKEAVSGDKEAINKLISIYEPYMKALAVRELVDDDGNEYIGIDVDLYDMLKKKLIHIIHNYKLV